MEARGQPEFALFQRTLFSTYLRPSAVLRLATLDVLSPPPSVAGMWLHAVLVVSPEEREIATKTGSFHMSVTLDNARDLELGNDLCRLGDHRLAQAGVAADDDTGAVTPFGLRARDFLDAWMSVVVHLQVTEICDTPYKGRHGGPSRDIQLQLRSLDAVQRRGHWKSLQSLRNYEKSGRLHKIVAKVPGWVMSLGERYRKIFLAPYPRSF